MRARLLLWSTLVLALAALAAGRPLAGQIGIIGLPCATSISPAMFGIGARNETFTATVRTTYEQRLADGNVIHQTTESTSARDANGRTMRQNVQGCGSLNDGENGSRLEVNVSDPKARTSLTWIVGPRSTHVAFLRHDPDVRRDLHPMRPPQLETLPKRPLPRNDQTSEQLGTRMIAGVEATGVRWTRIIPAGAEGNDLPIKSVRETWTSKTPRVELLVVEDDPRVGRRSWEVTSLSLTEPDPSLFAPPQGYTIEEGKPFDVPGATGSTGIGSTAGTVSGPPTPAR